MWDFQSLRDLSIQRLTDSGPASIEDSLQKVVVGIKFEVPPLVRDGVTELMQREKLQFTAEEKDVLGASIALQIHEVREEVLTWKEKRPANSIASEICPKDGRLMVKVEGGSPTRFDVNYRVRCVARGCARVADAEDSEAIMYIRRAIESVFPEARD